VNARSRLHRFALTGALCALLAMNMPSGFAEAPSPVTLAGIAEPRSFGHVIGDMLTRRIVLDAERGATLDTDGLPKPGRVSRWLDLLAVQHDASGKGTQTRYTITLTYQLMNADQEVRTLALPALRIPFKTAAQTLFHEVPEYVFTAGPLTPQYVVARAGLEEMQPDIPPPLLPTNAVRARLALYGAGLGAILLYFLYSYWGLPFFARSRGPFARALRKVNAARRASDPQEGMQLALKALHRAFDETAGGALFGEQLEGFFVTHQRYEPLRPAVERFFAVSRQAFFGAGSAPLSLSWLASLCRDLRDRERWVA
jgi:mxaA protein